jgi:hypothetical protein
MSMPWSRPDPPATFSIGDHAGEVVIVIVGGYHEAVSTRSFGEKPAARVSVVLLTGRNAGSIFEDVMFFGQKLASQFRTAPPGHVVLGRVTKVDKSVTIEPGSTYDEQTGMAWMNAFPGKLDALRAEAVRNFAEQAREMANKPNGGGNVAPSQQFVPPDANHQASLRPDAGNIPAAPAQAYATAPAPPAAQPAQWLAPAPTPPAPTPAYPPADVSPSEAYGAPQNHTLASMSTSFAPPAAPTEAGF